ncbi:MAG TPA: PucR family transcriptional regulator ligand-binding domain-containing protein, partial [Nakamurella sp.]
MPTIRTLLADTSLGLTQVAGPTADRPITAAAVSELTAPGPWLRGGELLMTIGVLLEMTESTCQDYVEGIVSAGVAALAVGLGADLPHQAAPPLLAAAADRVGLPLLTVPDEVPFIAVTKAVYAHLAAEERRELEWAFDTQRALTAAAVQPGGLSAILAAHHRASDCSAAVVDLLGRVLGVAGSDADTLPARLAGIVDSIRSSGLRAAGVDTDTRVRREVHPLGSTRLRGWLLLEGRADRLASQAVTAGLISLLTLDIERRYTLDTAQRRRRGSTLDRLARATIDDSTAARLLTAIGLSDQDLCCAVIAEDTDPQGLADDLATTLPDAMVRAVGDVVHVAVPAGVDLRQALSRVAAGRPAGIGIAVRPGALAISLRQATSALAVSRLRHEPVVATDVASSRLILSQIPTSILAGYADAVLGAIDACDQPELLLRTLSTFLESNGSWEPAAR